MNGNTQRMIDAITETGRVTLRVLKQRGVLVHVALTDMLSNGIKVRSMYSPTERTCVYWIGEAPVVSVNGVRNITISETEQLILEGLAGDGLWRRTCHIRDALRVSAARASWLMDRVKSGDIKLRCTVRARQLTTKIWEYKFEEETA